MNYELLGNNKLQLSGEVMNEPIYSHEVYGEGFYETVIKVARLSEQSDYIPITISERLLAEHNVKVGDKISIIGQFRSYNKQEGEKSRLILSAFVKDIVEESMLENSNIIQVSGYICKPPIYRTTPFNREICDVLMAVNRAYNKSDYIPCITWGRNARYARSLNVGDALTVCGRIQSRKYVKNRTDGESEERVAYEISVSKLTLDRDYQPLNIAITNVSCDKI